MGIISTDCVYLLVDKWILENAVLGTGFYQHDCELKILKNTQNKFEL